MYTFQFQTEQCSEIDHEVFSECGNNICQNTCEDPQKSLVCRGTCISGCVCQEGYLRNSQGACVLPAECAECLEADHQVFSECGNNICQNSCARPQNSLVCKGTCISGCVCEEGYLRNSIGNCVLPEDCECGENEVYSESGKTICENTCEEPRKITYCKAKSEAGCGCIEGYLKNSTNVCVLPENCDGGCDGDVNAYFDKCGDPCPRTCNNYKKGEMVCACIQAGGCKCKKGYVRDINKKCVLPSKCPQCGPNEFFDCGSACDTTCATLGDVCPIVNIKCNEMCYCVGGYARDKNNVCIPIKQCPPKFTCARNQTYDACPYTCPPEETCESHLSGIAFSCAEEPEPRTCVPKCKCSAGFLRKVNGGDCIKPNQCCNDPNAEIVSCPNPCPGGTCIAPAFANCKAPCKIRGCQCKSGYVKDANGKCILLSKCPKLCTKPNEKFYSCKPCVPSCTDKNPVCVAACIEGCACQPGYVRKSDSDSTCILEKNCPKLCTKPNEKYYTCKPCVPSCTNKNPMCAAACLEGCACQPGYVRKSDSDSTCILEKNCPPVCTRQNEQYYDCKPCTQLCRDVSPPCLEICIPGCDCKPGFFKNTDNGNLCVELDDCTCGQNEVFRGCPARCPPEPSCAAMFRVDQEPCTNRSSTACYHDCACKPNYVRNDLKLCVLPQKCCTDPNSELVSKPSCCPGGTCANPKFNNFCRMACPEKGCQCKKGFLKISDENKKCIPVKDCPKYP